MTRTIVIAAALALAVTLPAAPAQAAGRTFVSAAGNDSNPCSITLPCRNLQAAYNAVAANGQVEVLDPGNYGSLTITGPVSIQGHGWAGMSANTGAAITINAHATENIFISGVVLDGLGITGTNGIVFNSGASLTVRDSVIRNFTENGISFLPAIFSGISVSRTLVSKNGGYGILVQPQGATATAVFNRVETQYNGAFGIAIDATATTGTITATATDSVSSNNGGGFIVEANYYGTGLMLVRCTASNNHTGVQAGNTGGVSYGAVYMTQVAITGNVNGWQNDALTGVGVGVFSYGDNTIDFDQTADVAPPSTAKK